MLRGLYTAVSAMQATERKIDVISNNMANVNTTGFKKDLVITESFPVILLHKINGQLPNEPFNRNPKVGVSVENNAYSLSTNGGFFMASTPMGVSYSQETSFTVDDQGFLRTFSRDIEGKVDASHGNYILDNNKKPINIGEQLFEVSPEGNIIINGQVAANLVTKVGPSVIGTMNGGVRISKVETNFVQGELEPTGNDLDLAINGNGFFKVANSEGDVFYTRNGNFKLNTNGEIVTTEGYFLLNTDGASILVNGRDFQVVDDGSILDGNVATDKIDVTDIINVRTLRKQGEGYYRVAEGEELQTKAFTGKILQGYLEGSNVNTIKEMVEMISAFRVYESNQKVVRAYDELLQRAVNEVGKV